MQKNNRIRCSKCSRVVAAKVKYLPIATEDDEHYYFCTSCLLEAFELLGGKPTRNIYEDDLLRGIKDFLTEERLIAVS